MNVKLFFEIRIFDLKQKWIKTIWTDKLNIFNHDLFRKSTISWFIFIEFQFVSNFLFVHVAPHPVYDEMAQRYLKSNLQLLYADSLWWFSCMQFCVKENIHSLWQLMMTDDERLTRKRMLNSMQKRKEKKNTLEMVLLFIISTEYNIFSMFYLDFILFFISLVYDKNESFIIFFFFCV